MLFRIKLFPFDIADIVGNEMSVIFCVKWTCTLTKMSDCWVTLLMAWRLVE